MKRSELNNKIAQLEQELQALKAIPINLIEQDEIDFKAFTGCSKDFSQKLRDHLITQKIPTTIFSEHCLTVRICGNYANKGFFLGNPGGPRVKWEIVEDFGSQVLIPVCNKIKASQ